VATGAPDAGVQETVHAVDDVRDAVTAVGTSGSIVPDTSATELVVFPVKAAPTTPSTARAASTPATAAAARSDPRSDATLILSAETDGCSSARTS
jgi:hypothetical protein